MLKKHTVKIYIVNLVVILTGLILTESRAEIPGSYWNAPFPDKQPVTDMRMTHSLLRKYYFLLPGKMTPLKSLERYVAASSKYHEQAGQWRNPELELEMENLGWDAPGFSEYEITVLLSQEIDLFGRRNAERRLAEMELEFANWDKRRISFEIFLKARLAYYRLAHAQNHLHLAGEALELARTIHHDIEMRINKGAAMQAEFLLTQLEFQKTQLLVFEAENSAANASRELAAMWGGNDSTLTIAVGDESEHLCFKNICELDVRPDSIGEIITLEFQKRMRLAEKDRVRAEVKPSLTFSGGIKRSAEEGFNSFVMGVSLPLAFFNRGKGTISGLEAEVEALDFEKAQTKSELTAQINSYINKILQLDEKLEIIDTLLLPIAEKTYTALEQAYHSGRLPYTSLLEGERALIELLFEKNDIYLQIREEQVALESLIGISLDDYNNRGNNHEN